MALQIASTLMATTMHAQFYSSLLHFGLVSMRRLAICQRGAPQMGALAPAPHHLSSRD